MTEGKTCEGPDQRGNQYENNPAADDLPAEDDETEDGKGEKVPSMLFSRRAFAKAVTNKITDHIKSLEPEPEEVPAVFVPADPLMDRLRDIKKSF